MARRRSNPRGLGNLRMPLILGGVWLAGQSGVLGTGVKHALGKAVDDIKSIGGGHRLADGGMASGRGLPPTQDPNNPAAIPYGRALWAEQHGGDPSGYDAAGQAVQANWNAVAIHGK